MAQDFDIARQIIATLESLQESEPFLRDPCSVELNHEKRIESERIQDTEIRVSPESIQHTRVARAASPVAWQDDFGIRIKLVGKSKNRLDTAELETWCDFVDQITRHMKAAKIACKKVSTITLRNNERYNPVVLEEYSVYTTTLLVGLTSI